MAFDRSKSPLERLLRETFGEVPDPDIVRHLPTEEQVAEDATRLPAALGSTAPERDVNTRGLRPGNVYSGGPQTQPQGIRGTEAQALMRRWEGLFRGKNPSRCGPIATPECADILSRLLEQTFRNFQLAARLPSHVSPPFSSRPINALGSVTVNVGAFVNVVVVTIPQGHRGAVVAVGQALENMGAFNDVTWRILLNGQPVHPYEAFTEQLGEIPCACSLGRPIDLRGGDVLALQAKSTALAHTGRGRLTGWFYPVRVEMDQMIGSTLTD